MELTEEQELELEVILSYKEPIMQNIDNLMNAQSISFNSRVKTLLFIIASCIVELSNKTNLSENEIKDITSKFFEKIKNY